MTHLYSECAACLESDSLDVARAIYLRQQPDGEWLLGLPEAWAARPGDGVIAITRSGRERDQVLTEHVGRVRGLEAWRFTSAGPDDAAAADGRAAVWRAASSPAPLGLHAALAAVRPGGGLPAERPEARPAVPEDVEAGASADHLLPAMLKPSEKQALDLLADWPWIPPGDLAALLGVSASRLSSVLLRLRELELVVRAPLAGRRLALSDRALTLLAHRDRASAALARKRWSAEVGGGTAGHDWRAIPGTRSRQLARHIAHTAGVHWFLAQLAEQARAEDWRAAQLDPPHRAARYFRYGGALRSIHPDAFGVLRRGNATRPFFLEWERRALHPSTMSARLAPYLRYYATDRPLADHGAMPAVLVVFEDAVAPAHLLRIARGEVARSGIDLPLWTASREDLGVAGPLGSAWRNPEAPEAARVFA